MAIRGDLLKKYPTTVIFAQEAKWSKDDDGNDIRILDPAMPIKSPIFKAEIDPDLKFLGFDLIEKEVKGDPERAANNPGYFFVLQQRPGEPRFGLDLSTKEELPAVEEWNDLSWQHLATEGNIDDIDFIDIAGASFTLPSQVERDEGPSPVPNPDLPIEWGENAANMAYILYQVPVMVAFHAADMLEK